VSSHTEIAIQQAVLPLELLAEDVQAGRLTPEVGRERFEAMRPTPEWAETMAADFDTVLAAYEAAWADLETT